MKHISTLIIAVLASLPVSMAYGNLLQDPSFETGGHWNTSGAATRVNSNARAGSYSMRVSSEDNGAWQEIAVTPGSTYTLTAWGKKDSGLGYLIIFVKNYGGTEIHAPFTSTTYGLNSITFVPTAASCLVGVWAWNGSGYGYVDDLVLTSSSPIPQIKPPPPAPSGLRAVAASATRINLSWSDNSHTETGFKVERSINGSPFTQIAAVGANVINYSNTGLSASTKYYYRVRAYNSTGASAYSNTALATTPSGATPTPTATPRPSPTPTPAPTATPAPTPIGSTGQHFWIAVRTDGLLGTGTQSDPYDGSTPTRFDALMSNLQWVPNPTIHLVGPGPFRTNVNHNWLVRSGWVVSGDGMYNTTVQATGSLAGMGDAVVFRSDPNYASNGVTIKNLTIDCNWPGLAATAVTGAGGEKNCKIGAVMICGSNNLLDHVRSINTYSSLANFTEGFAMLLAGPPSANGTNDVIQYCRAELPRGNHEAPLGLAGWIFTAPTRVLTNSKVVACTAVGVYGALSTAPGFASGGVNLANVKDCQIDGNTFIDCFGAAYIDTGSVDGLKVTNNTVIRGWQGVGLVSWVMPKQNIQISGNNFNIQNRVPNGAGYGIASAYGATTNVTVDRNTITFDTSGPGISSFWGIGLGNISNTTVSNNTVGLAYYPVENSASGLGMILFNNRTPAGVLIPTLNNQ